MAETDDGTLGTDDPRRTREVQAGDAMWTPSRHAIPGQRNRGANVNYGNYTETELKAAMARGVRQIVVIGSRPDVHQDFEALPEGSLEIFAVADKEPSLQGVMTFVPTQFDSEKLADALGRSSFDRLKTSLFVWLGASYRTVDAALSTLAFIASLPKGSGVLFDYSPERTSSSSWTETALDALASRVSCASGAIKHLIQPQAVSALLRGLGFRQMTEYKGEEFSLFEEHLVSALV